MSIPLALASLAIVLTLAGCAGTSAIRRDAAMAAGQNQATENKTATLNALYARYWDELLRINPLQATFQGDHRYNDQLPDFGSAEFRERSRRFNQQWLERIERIGADGLHGQDLLSYQIFIHDARISLEADRYPNWMQPIDQMGGIPTVAALLGSGAGAQPFKTVRDYDDWLARGNRLPILFDTIIDNMRQGMRSAVVQPRPLMQKVLPQLDAIIRKKPENSLFWGPIRNMPAEFDADQRKRLTDAYRKMIDERIMPAYRKLRTFIAEHYIPNTRTSVGLDALPDGAAWYAFNVRKATSTQMTPAQIHQLGLDEVKRIHAQIRQVMRQVGFRGDLRAFFDFMRNDKRFRYRSDGELLKHHNDLKQIVQAHVPAQFSLLPKASVQIRPVEAFRAKSAAGGEYLPPSEDGRRTGIFYVNTSDLSSRRRWEAEDLFLHEAIPGHHFQLALQQELTALPKFRRFGGETAFVEGWGLYAESLGREMGLYTDPYSYFGYLRNALWRAIRLVADTGLHSRGWSRERVIDYMLENSAESKLQAIAETERYIAWPGQALAYKIGELKIMQARHKAERALGDHFDIRAFHAEVLKDGSVPLAVLEAKIDRWIADQRAAAIHTTPQPSAQTNRD